MPGHEFERTRERFNKVLEAYLNYAALYKLCNNGSLLGVTPFNVFYWRFTYLVRYEDPDRISAMR